MALFDHIAKMQAFNRGVARGAAQATRGTLGTIAGAGGFLRIIHDHPWATSGAILTGSLVMGYGNEQQAVPRGPATVNQRPGTMGPNDRYDLGATGDLVFSLHRLGQ